jgi:hypothetical protein
MEMRKIYLIVAISTEHLLREHLHGPDSRTKAWHIITHDVKED